MRPPGLYTLCWKCIAEDQPVRTEGLTITSPTQDVMLVASVPLTDEAWTPLDEGEVVVVSEGNIVKGKTFDAQHPRLSNRSASISLVNSRHSLLSSYS
jgi:glutamine amidotransferase